MLDHFSCGRRQTFKGAPAVAVIEDIIGAPAGGEAGALVGFCGVDLAAVIGGEEDAGNFGVALIEEVPAHGGLIEGAIACKKVFAGEL